MSGARLAILYGYVPCQLGLCGPENAKKKKIITKYLKGKKNLENEIKKILKEFKGAYPYYQLIARSNKIGNPLDVKVVEAYWLGNSLLDTIKVSEFKKMIRSSFVPLGKISETKVKNLPNSALPYHNFHVLFLGSVTGRINLKGKISDVCRVSSGEVKKIKKDFLAVEYKPLKFGKKITLGNRKIKKIKWNKDILPEVKIGDWISMHWNTAIQVLKTEEIENLNKYTIKILKH